MAWCVIKHRDNFIFYLPVAEFGGAEKDNEKPQLA
jgi:hypothetical protein